MWDRKELKEKAKIAFKANYWRCVAAALIVALLVSGVSFGISSRARVPQNLDIKGLDSEQELAIRQDLTELFQNPNSEQAQEILQDIIDNLPEGVREMDQEMALGIFAVLAVIIVGIIMLVALVRGALRIFIGHALEVGGDRFFWVNSGDQASLKEILYGFTNRYGRNIGALFLRGLYIWLWSLLFVIPGIVKAYSYRLVPYILADDAEVTQSEAFRMSRQLMRGNKWRAFVLDLSFIGWKILNVFTAGLLGLFYVNPYIRATEAEFYKALRYGENG